MRFQNLFTQTIRVILRRAMPANHASKARYRVATDRETYY